MKQNLSLPVHVPAEQQDYGLIKEVLIQAYIDNGCKMPLWPSVPRITGLDKTRILTVFCHNNGWREAEKLIPEFAKEELAAGDAGQQVQDVKEHIEEAKEAEKTVRRPMIEKGYSESSHEGKLQPNEKTLDATEMAQQAKKPSKRWARSEALEAALTRPVDDSSWVNYWAGKKELADDELTCDERDLINQLTHVDGYDICYVNAAVSLVRRRKKDEFDRCMIEMLKVEEVQRCLSRTERRKNRGEAYMCRLFDIMTEILGRKPNKKELDEMNVWISTPKPATFRKYKLVD